MSQDVSSKVKKIVADHLGVEESKVAEESSFIDDLGEISDSEAEKILTVGDAIKFIESKSN